MLDVVFYRDVWQSEKQLCLDCLVLDKAQTHDRYHYVHGQSVSLFGRHQALMFVVQIMSVNVFVIDVPVLNLCPYSCVVKPFDLVFNYDRLRSISIDQSSISGCIRGNSILIRIPSLGSIPYSQLTIESISTLNHVWKDRSLVRRYWPANERLEWFAVSGDQLSQFSYWEQLCILLKLPSLVLKLWWDMESRGKHVLCPKFF